MEPLYIVMALLVGLDIIAILLILIDDLYYLGAEKILPILFTIFLPLFGALIMISKLKGDEYNSSSNGNKCDACTYEFFSNGDFSSGGGDF